jgi:putative sigma-54 modulation protein
MKVHFTGKIDKLTPPLQKKLDARFAKLGKLLDGQSEKEAHVILNAERHLKKAEITVNYAGHVMAGLATDSESFTALVKALDKLEKQLHKQSELKRESRKDGQSIKNTAPVEVSVPEPRAPRIFRVKLKNGRKPMSVEEAVLEIGAGKDYFVYRDDTTDRVSVLLRRRDGDFDLVEP